MLYWLWMTQKGNRLVARAGSITEQNFGVTKNLMNITLRSHDHNDRRRHNTVDASPATDFYRARLGPCSLTGQSCVFFSSCQRKSCSKPCVPAVAT
ncbi:hypothetical protein BaRGS_00033237 [Batillaria attramentaria]|uniref:Secreted protein n=1 Tax=Batillaria attramentaria TaxID=370345 RepID=A0ABD0JL84_9CAEN